MDYYERVMTALEEYFHVIQKKDWKKLFLTGGCYWLADYLCRGIPGSYLVINRAEEHCAVWIQGSVYDVRGKISGKNFRRATERDISFMKKNYVAGDEVRAAGEWMRERKILL